MSIFKSILNFIKKLLPWAKESTAVGRDIANEIKTIIDNPTWDVVVSLTQTKLDDAALAALRAIMAETMKWLGLADKAIGYGEQIGVVFKQASTALQELPPDIKAGQLNTIAAIANKTVAELKGNDMPIATALSIQQLAYSNPELIA